MVKDNYVRIRVTDDQKDAFKAAADKDGRTMSNWIIWVLEQEIQKQAKKK